MNSEAGSRMCPSAIASLLASRLEKVRFEDKAEMIAKLKASVPKPSATSGPRLIPPARPKRALTPSVTHSNAALVTPSKFANLADK